MKKYSILITDDDDATHEVLGEYLELAGFRVLHARDGAAGLGMLEEYRPDLMLLDVNMPVMDGFRTMETIAKIRELRDIPVLFLTSLDRSNLKVKGLELGAEDYIVKPYNKAELLARVKGALRRGARYRRDEGAMEGDLGDMSLADLLQTMDIGRKTACIHLKEVGGSICVRDGQIIHATFRDFTGADAVVRLVFLERGAFSVNFDHVPSAAELTPVPIQKALFETVAYVDELRAMASAVSPEYGLIEIPDSCPAEFAGFSRLSPLKLHDLIVMMEGDLKDNTMKIKEALGRKRLALVS